MPPMRSARRFWTQPAGPESLKMTFTAIVSTTEQLRAALSCGPFLKRVILDSAVAEPEHLPALSQKVRDAGKDVYYAFPAVFQEQARQYYLEAIPFLQKSGFSGFLVRSLEEYAFCRENALEGRFLADHSIYALNSEAANVLLQAGFSELTAPLEASAQDLYGKCASMELIVYGYVPMMVSHNCVHATMEGCDRKFRPLILTDRLSHQMRAVNDCRFCLSTIYNCVPLYLLDCGKDLLRLSPESLRLSFTYETGAETARILALAERAAEAFENGQNGPAFPYGDFTRGHFKNSVE